MCKAQTTIKQVNDQIKTQGEYTVKEGMNFVSSQGNKTD